MGITQPYTRPTRSLSRRCKVETGARAEVTPADISVLLSSDTIKTVGDVSRQTPEGSRLSPLLLNLYIATPAIWLEVIPPAVSDSTANLFADDILFIAKTIPGLQRLLDRCSKWTGKINMHWAPDKCAVLSTNTERQPLFLTGEII